MRLASMLEGTAAYMLAWTLTLSTIGNGIASPWLHTCFLTTQAHQPAVTFYYACTRGSLFHLIIVLVLHDPRSAHY